MSILIAKIMYLLKNFYLIDATTVAPYNMGADVHAVLFQVSSSDSKTYFVKMKQAHFDDMSTIAPLPQPNLLAQVVRPCLILV
jgi:hypothetical protein